MKKLTIIFALALFFICGTAVSANAFEIAENPLEVNTSTEISDLINASVQPSSSTENVGVPVTAVGDLGSCTIVAVISCGDVGFEVEVTADTCAEAGAVIDDVADKTNCG